MTQNTSYSGSTSSGSMASGSMASGSMSGDKHDHHDDPNEIRADIDQTRAAVGEKIDQLQARLDPSRLKQQAQETVQEMLTDTANSMTEYVRTHRDDMVSSLADAARRNPLPTALVGLGVGWLILESMAGKKRDEEYRWQGERRNLSSRGMRRSSPGYIDREFIDDEYFDEEYANYRPATTPLGASGSAAMGSEYRAEYEGGHDYGNGKQQGSNPVAKAADAVKDTVSDVGHEIKERVSDVTERVSDTGQEIKERVGGAIGGMRRQAGDMRGQGEYRMQKAGYRLEEMQQRARYEGRRRGQQVIRNLEDNPLTYGALALAAGAALAILLPRTRTENRVFGEMRDQVVERGQEVVETAKDRAQEVISEIRPELEEKARQLASDVKEMGKEVAQDAAEELRPVVDKAVSRTKEEAKNVAQEIGVNPEKMTGSSSGSGSAMASSSTSSPAMGSSSMGTSSTGTATKGGSTTSGTTMSSGSPNDRLVINRDTLRGQWTQIKGEIKSKWGKLTDDELTRVEGDMEKLIGVLQTRYGYARGRAEQEVNDFMNSRKM